MDSAFHKRHRRTYRYRLGIFTLVGLGFLLATGAIRANDSWGRYRGWGAKEVGALCEGFTNAVLLHARITRSWQGRMRAYFGALSLLLVIFTYLGVGCPLPGPHR